MALDLGGNKKKQNDKSKYSIVELALFKPGKKKYAEFDYEEIRKKQLKEDDSSGDDERFHDREALEIVKRLEAKYGGKKDKKGRKLCFGTEDDYMDKRAGYDLEDDFIDDSEAYDELIPSTMDTVQGGFYVNRGKLEFKTKHEEVNDSDISDSDDGPQQKKGTKRSQISSDDDIEAVEDVAASDASSKSDVRTVSDMPVSIPANQKPRMLGAPPSKVRRIALGESANQRAANAIKKRLVGMPPTMLKRKVFQTFAPRRDNEVPEFPRTIAGEPILPASNDKTDVAGPSSAPSSSTNKSPDKSSIDPLAPPKICNTTGHSQNTVETATSGTVISSSGMTSPKKRPLAPMTDTLSNMIAEFKRCTNNLALPGQKKRLQNIHVDMVIAIEEQCLKDGYSVHEKARVAHSLADYCGIQKNSLYARCIKRRDEHKNGAPNLAFLVNSPFTGKGGSGIASSGAAKVSSTSLEPSLTAKTTVPTVPTVTATKSMGSNPVAVLPSPTKSGSLPVTSASSSSASSTTKTSVPSTATSVHTNLTTNSLSSSTLKTSQLWTSQKKLAAQAMITNVAGLLPSSERLGDVQEILKRVFNETITYDDFLKWHDKSMKSVSPKCTSGNKSLLNGIVRNNPSTSSISKIASAGIGTLGGVVAAAQSKNSTPSSSVSKMTSGGISASGEVAVATQSKNPTPSTSGVSKMTNGEVVVVGEVAAVQSKNPTPSTSGVSKMTSGGIGALGEVAGTTQSKSSANVPSSVTKRVSLAQAMATSKLPPRTRPLTLSNTQISEKFESDKQTTLRAVATAIDNSKIAYKKKCDVATAAGKPAPRFDFLWTENLARALKTQLDLYWSVLLSSDSYAKSADGIVTVFAKEIFPYFRGEIKLSRLLIEYTRRSPEKAFLLACPSVQRLLKDENIDLNNITVLTKKEKTGNDSVASRINPSAPYKPILPVRSSSSDEIQTTPSQNDPDVVVIEPSTSNATTSNGDAANASPSSSTAASNQGTAALSELGINMTPTQMSELSSALHHLTSITNDPQKLLVLQQALLMQVVSHNQADSKKKQVDGKKKDDEGKKKSMEQEKEEKKRLKDERRMKLIAQKKELAACAKEKALEEKRLRLEEEKRQKLAEKARKAEEEREKRLEEQAEKERLLREERERLLKEAAEKKKQEDEERQRLEQIRVKVEEEKAKELEQQRQAELREEEKKAAQLLEEEILMEEVSQSAVPPELKLVLEEEEEAESIRLKKQEEQVAAVRAANLAAQNQLVHSASVNNPTTPSHNLSQASLAEKKPPPMNIPKQQNATTVGCSISQQSNVVRSPITSAIHSSPQYPNPGSYGLPGSHSSNSAMTSPQCMMSMTPPPHRSPAFHQPQVVQSPLQYQPVESPLSAGQQSSAVIQRPSVQTQQCPQQINQHQPTVNFDQVMSKGQSFTQPQPHVTPHQNSFGFGMQQQIQRQQQQQQRQQQYHMQKQPMRHQPQAHQSVSLHQSLQHQHPHQQQQQQQQQQSTFPQQPMMDQSMQIERGANPQQMQQHQHMQHQQMQVEQQQSGYILGQYQNQMCQQQMMDHQQQLILQQQRTRDMYMLQHQHQQLALQRQQHHQQQQQHPQQQQQFNMTQDRRAFHVQQQQAYQNDPQHHEVRQQHMMNQYAHNQPQNQDMFRY